MRPVSRFDRERNAVAASLALRLGGHVSRHEPTVLVEGHVVRIREADGIITLDGDIYLGRMSHPIASLVEAYRERAVAIPFDEQTGVTEAEARWITEGL